jgi:hypothetical protein
MKDKNRRKSKKTAKIRLTSSVFVSYFCRGSPTCGDENDVLFGNLRRLIHVIFFTFCNFINLIISFQA